MLHGICYVTSRGQGLIMAVGISGRVVIEIDPKLKKQLYAVLDRDGKTLKEWFVGNAISYLEHSLQPSLFGSEPAFVQKVKSK